MKEKRKTQRRYLLYYMRIYDTATRKQIGNLVDISSGGVMVIGEHLIPEGRTTHLRMELTHDVAKKPFMEFSARSKWCNPYITPNLFNTGFEILATRISLRICLIPVSRSWTWRPRMLR